jgi:cell division septum initiation protein DivIVA|tara:strand:- start:298 stop:474 length:177 start_codon:yes stop_codon:yes gene_type:complete
MTYQQLLNENHDLNLQIMKLSNDLDKAKNTLKKSKKEINDLTQYIIKKLEEKGYKHEK